MSQLTIFDEAPEAVPQPAITLYNTGEFLEARDEDAVTLARDYCLTLSSRLTEEGQRQPVCAIPLHARDRYIHMLKMHDYDVTEVHS